MVASPSLEKSGALKIMPKNLFLTILSSPLVLLADIGDGLLVASLVGIIWDVPPSIPFITWTLLWSFAPDLDNVPYLLRGRMGSGKTHMKDHREGLHYPLGWAIFFTALFIFFPGNPWLIAAGLAVLLHFFNDTWGTGWGVMWLWPYSRDNYQIFAQDFTRRGNPHRILVRYTPEVKNPIMEQYGDTDWILHIYAGLKPLVFIEFGIFLLGVSSVYVWYAGILP